MEGEAQEHKAMEFKEKEEEEVTEPVSPTGQYFNSSVLSICVLAVLESEVPIDDSLTMTLLKDVFLPINPRFSSIMVNDKNSEKQWKRVEVQLQNHVNIPIFPIGLSTTSYDNYFNDYSLYIKNSTEAISTKPAFMGNSSCEISHQQSSWKYHFQASPCTWRWFFSHGSSSFLSTKSRQSFSFFNISFASISFKSRLQL